MNTPLNKPGSHYPEIRAQRKNMDPRLQHRERFVSIAHFPNNNGVNQRGYQLWITPYALDAIQFLPSQQARFDILRGNDDNPAIPCRMSNLAC